MGCCFSSANKNLRQPDACRPPPLPESGKGHVDSRAPPPVLEEETVKEVVLSETPVQKPQILKENRTHMPVIEEGLVGGKDYVNKNQEEEEISQVSEIYSISESFSTTTTATTTTTTTTTAITEKREDEAISKPTKVSHRSPAKVPRKRPYTGELCRGAKSPAKRTETSHVGPRKTMPRNVKSNGVRRESGEGPLGQRSRSPATRTAGAVGRSPGKVTAGRPSGLSRVENTGHKDQEPNDTVLQQQKSEYINESIDNPHVSLECFIFL